MLTRPLRHLEVHSIPAKTCREASILLYYTFVLDDIFCAALINILVQLFVHNRHLH